MLANSALLEGELGTYKGHFFTNKSSFRVVLTWCGLRYERRGPRYKASGTQSLSNPEWVSSSATTRAGYDATPLGLGNPHLRHPGLGTTLG